MDCFLLNTNDSFPLLKSIAVLTMVKRTPANANNGTVHRQRRNSHGINANANTNPNIIVIALAHTTQRLKNEVYLLMIVESY